MVDRVSSDRDIVDVVRFDPTLQHFGRGVTTGVVNHEKLNAVIVEQLFRNALEQTLDQSFVLVSHDKDQNTRCFARVDFALILLLSLNLHQTLHHILVVCRGTRQVLGGQRFAPPTQSNRLGRLEL